MPDDMAEWLAHLQFILNIPVVILASEVGCPDRDFVIVVGATK